MSFLEKVAEAQSQREATLVIAGALDIIFDAITQAPDSGGWEDWPTTPPAEVQIAAHRERLEAPADVRMAKEGTDYVIPKPSPVIERQREQFAANFLPDPTMSSAYPKGGPEWLTAYDTEFVLSLPGEARQLMALDLEQRGLTQEAREFAVAFLKGDASNMATAAPLADTLKNA